MKLLIYYEFDEHIFLLIEVPWKSVVFWGIMWRHVVIVY